MSCPVTQLLNAMTAAERMHDREPPPGYRYTSIAAFVLDKAQCSCGREMSPRELRVMAEAWEKYKRFWGSPRPKECYANAQKLIIVARNDELLYAEGYAIHPGSILPVLHAWVELDGAIIDPTPIWNGKGLGVFGDGHCYHAAFRCGHERIIERVSDRSELASFIDDWNYGFPLLRK